MYASFKYLLAFESRDQTFIVTLKDKDDGDYR